MVFAGWTLYPVLQLQYEQQREVQTLEAELAGLKERNEVLSEQVDRLKTPEGVEEAARESLGFVRDGEDAYVVTGVEDPELAPEAVNERTRSADPTETAWWWQALDLVFGVR
ncbi:MAG: septum formation initiator family protein [Anaerosomatales bacterium]|nr:septum formation initiator family protein [Anaerosomatales bacterium]